MGIPIPIIGAVIDGVTGWFTKKQEIKAATQSAKEKLALNKHNLKAQIELSKSEWEALAVQSQQGSWKDEYITLVITSPIVLILLGSVLMAFGIPAGIRIVDGALNGIIHLNDLGMDYGFALSAVVLGAVGIKAIKA